MRRVAITTVMVTHDESVLALTDDSMHLDDDSLLEQHHVTI